MALTDHGGSHFGTGDERRADLQVVTITNSEDIKLDRAASFGAVQALDAQKIVLRDSVLLSTCANHSVHL